MKLPVVVTPASSAAPVRRFSEPLTFAVPLPRGLLVSPERWSLAPVTGLPVELDTRVLDRWADGTARWVLVDACVTVDPGEPQTWTLDTASPALPGQVARRAIVVSETATGIAIDTGAARVAIVRGGRFPFDQVDIDGTPVLDAATLWGVAITDARGHRIHPKVEQIAIEHQGWLRSSIRVEASVRTGDGRRLDLEARVECFAGSAVVRVLSTIRNPDRARHPGNFWDLGDPGSVLLKDVSIELKAAPHSQTVSIRTSTEATASWATTTSSLLLYQDSSGGECWQGTNHINRERRVPTTFRGFRLQMAGQEIEGLRATPIVLVESAAVRIGVSVPAFWQNFPKAIEADDRGLSVRLFPGQFGDLHELQGGEQKTHECFFAFGSDPITDHPLEWTRRRTLASPAPDWVLASGAVDFLGRLDADYETLLHQAIEGPDRFEQKREVIDQFGWRHFGEIYGDHEAIGHTGPQPLVSHYNNQYDPVAGFALQFLRTGDPRWWAAMNELAAHVIDIDIYHTDQDKAAYNGGLFWHTYHYGDADTATHRTYPRKNTGTVHGGGPSADHNYPTGLMLRYFLTGDEASRQAAIGLAQYVLNLDDWRLSPFRWLSHADTGRTIFTPPNFFGPARSSGNSLNALVDGHRLTGDPKFLAKADQLVRRVVHPNDDMKKSRLDEPEYRWFYAMFLQALGKYLSHKAELGLIDRAYAHGRASLLAYARWMAEHEYPYLEKPEKLEYPTETWAAQDIRKSDILYYAALHSSGAERVRFVDRADFFHRTSVQTLLGMPTRALARPVIVLLTSGFLKAWFVDHTDAVLPVPAVEEDFGAPERFIAQRAQAERRAKLIVAAGAVATVSAALAGLVWWIQRM